MTISNIRPKLLGFHPPNHHHPASLIQKKLSICNTINAIQFMYNYYNHKSNGYTLPLILSLLSGIPTLPPLPLLHFSLSLSLSLCWFVVIVLGRTLKSISQMVTPFLCRILTSPTPSLPVLLSLPSLSVQVSMN